jgi:FkbM family methyltransferase
VIQVGIGQYHQEVDVLKEEWPGVRFIGFDPCPNVADDYPGVLFQHAISDSDGEAIFNVKKHHKDGSSLYEMDGANGCEKIKVVTRRLDSCIVATQATGRILLWLDCEGSELAALRGGGELVKWIDMVNVEMTSKPPGPDWCSPTEVHRWLTWNGFLRQWIHTGRISSGQYDAVYVKPNLFKAEYCCDPVSLL